MSGIDGETFSELHEMLPAAAFMGLHNTTRVLREKYKVDPLYLPKALESSFKLNPIQAAVMRGYVEIVKTLT